MREKKPSDKCSSIRYPSKKEIEDSIKRDNYTIYDSNNNRIFGHITFDDANKEWWFKPALTDLRWDAGSLELVVGLMAKLKTEADYDKAR